MIGVAILVVFAAMLVRTVKKPGVAVALLLLFFAGKQLVQVSIPFFAESGPVVNFLVFGPLGLIWLYRALHGRAERMLGIPREYALQLVFIALAMLSTLWCMDPEIRVHLLERIPFLAIYALLVPSLLGSTRGITESYQWTAWVGGAMCLIFLFGYSEPGGATRLSLQAEMGTGDTLGLNPLAIGQMGAFTLIAAALGEFPRRRFVSLLRLAVAALALVVVARSSRGDLFAALFTVGVFGLIPTSATNGLQGRRLVGGLVAVALAAAVLYYGLFMTDYWARYENLSQDSGVFAREEMMRGVWDYFIDHPSTWIFGSGWCSSYAIVGFYPHNGPVQVLGELGVVGAAVWWSSIIFVFTRGLRLALLANRVGSRSLDVVRPALALMVCTFLSNLKAGDCVDIWLALTLSTVSQLIRRFRPESEKSLLR